jgi:protein-disulfide isomerase
MNKVFSLLFAVAIVGAACNKTQETRQTSGSASDEPLQTVAEMRAEEQANAKVTIVKFNDYQCPGCAFFYSFEKQLKQDFGDDVAIISKHFPLSIHPYAHAASRSVEAARKQGKYQEMHELIFVGQQQWAQGNAEAIFIGYAQSLGLDIDQFTADMNSAEMNKIVMEDRREGIDLAIRSTPTFFINGDLIENNPPSYELFKELVESYMD